MRLRTIAIATISAVSALTTPNPAHAFTSRDLVQGTGCALVDVNLPRTVDGLCNTPALNGLCTFVVRGVLRTLVTTTLAAVGNPLVTLCLCTEAGILTPESVADLNVGLAANVGVLNTVNSLLGTVLPGINLSAIVGPLAAANVATQTSACEYPDNSTPICSTETCAFECGGGFFECNAGDAPTCLADGSPCGSPTRRRRRQMSNHLLCDAGRSACALPGNKFGFECLDTRSDVESCGGCAFPLPGAKAGSDCTAIPHVADVSCVAGRCVVESCVRGHVLTGDECVPILKRQVARR